MTTGACSLGKPGHDTLVISSLPKFKSLTFHKGLNTLLADATDAAAAGNTRNSAGKTSFVQIVDFLLGASAETDSLFRSAELVEVEFTGVFRVRDRRVTVTRSGKEHGKLFLPGRAWAAGRSGENRQGVQSGRTCPTTTGADIWATRGSACPRRKGPGDFGRKNAPTFRPMMKYFLRLDSDGGFNHPERNSENSAKIVLSGLSVLYVRPRVADCA